MSHVAHTRAFWRWLSRGFLWGIRRVAGFALAWAALLLVIFGVFRAPGTEGSTQLIALAGLCVVTVARLVERLQRSVRPPLWDAQWTDLELGTLFIAGAFVLIELTGGPEALLYPLVYVLVAFLVAFHGPWLSAYFLLIILGTEAAVLFLGEGPADLKLFGSHASFICLFGFLYALFLRSEVATHRMSVDRAIADRLASIDSEARDFRLTSGLSLESRDLGAEELTRRRRIGSVQAIHDSLYNVLAVAERALNPYTVALLWMDADDERMRVKELRSQSDWISETPIKALEGVVGAITKRREPIVLHNLRPGHGGLVYYARPEPVTDFAGVPVLEGAHLRGVLVADRTSGEGFSESDLEVMQTIAQEIVRAVQVEQIFSEMDSEKYQRDRFYQASRDFNRALTVDEVARVAIDATLRVAQADFAALAVAMPDAEGRLRVQAVQWAPGAKAPVELEGREFVAEGGLVGAAIKARHPLPINTVRTANQRVFDESLRLDLDHIKVLPLLWKETGVGALVLGGTHEGFLGPDALDMLRVIADHAAIAIANGQMYERMQRMATTDGLTGLVNHRHFQERLDDQLARSERYGRRVSLLLLDIDHFKSINDTYGHPVGDMVLKRVARLLDDDARKTDVVARYGGEEFAVILDETERSGAVQIADRIRQKIEGEHFRCEIGNFRCTLSLGVATYPDDARAKARLIECADQALYAAKRGGRNRVVTFTEV